MDDEVEVRVRDGVADLEKEPEPLAEVEPVRLGIGRDRLAIDELHREEGRAVGGETAVEEAGDAGVVETGEEGALAEEAGPEVGGEAGVDELEGGVLCERVIGALGPVDGAHAAAPEMVRHVPRTDALTEERIHRIAGRVVSFGPGEDGAIERPGCVIRMPREHGCDLAPGLRVVAGRGEPRVALLGSPFECLGEEGGDAGVVGGQGHAASESV